MGLSCTRCEVPVHAPHVIAWFVHTAVAWVGPGSGRQPLVVALEQPIELARDHQLQLSERTLATRDGDSASHDAQAVTSDGCTGATRGARTVRTTRSTIWSAVTPSARAS